MPLTQKLTFFKELSFYAGFIAVFIFLFSYLFAGENDTFLWYSLIALFGICIWSLFLYWKGNFESVESIVGNWMVAFLFLYPVLPVIYTVSLVKKFDLLTKLPFEVTANQVWIIDILLYGLLLILAVYFFRFIVLLFSIGFDIEQKKAFRFISAAYIFITVFCAALSQIPEIRTLISSSENEFLQSIVNHYRFIKSATPEYVRNVVIGLLTGFSGFYFGVLTKKADAIEKAKTS